MPRRNLSILDAPSNLGLRPPEEGSPPGCYKQPWALRNRGLVTRLRAQDAGCVIPGRYQAAWRSGDGTRNAVAIAEYSHALADRVGDLLDAGRWPLVIGGDCSILLGNALALKRRGRYGLAYIDAHTDFRHPGNEPAILAAAGEDLALVTGRGDPRLIDFDGLGALFREDDVVLVGTRPEDEARREVEGLGMRVFDSASLREAGPSAIARRALGLLTENTLGFWIHLDWDVIDRVEMPAVDSPEADGPTFRQLTPLLRHLVKSPRCVGMEVTIYDPDLDPTGICADRIVNCLERVLELKR